MPLFPSLSQALAFLVLCTAAYYAFARADLTRPLWSRYPAFLDRMARCPACSGFWIGAALGLALPDDTTPAKRVLGALLGAAWGTVVTPLGTWALVSALAATTIPDEPPGPPPPPPGDDTPASSGQ